MKLDLTKIKSVTNGAVEVIEENGRFRFKRFNKAEDDFYKQTPFYSKSLAPAGIRLEFETDAEKLRLSVEAIEKTSREYFCFEIFVNEKCIGVIKNYDNVVNGEYAKQRFSIGIFDGEFALGSGTKTVKIIFPWSLPCEIIDVELFGETFIKPIKRKKKILIYGDSITQGYDALLPSHAYSLRLADALDAEGFNKAIGGEIYCPELAEIKNDFEPDYVIAAYGINDWRTISKTEYEDRCDRFWQAISGNYPKAKKFAFSPIWIKCWEDITEFGAVHEVEETIRKVVGKIGGITVIRCWDFVPHDVNFYGDASVHPNNDGFDSYFENLLQEIKKHI